MQKPLIRSAVLSLTLAIACASSLAVADDSLYQTFNEKTGIQKLVDNFFAIVLSDSRISGSFQKTDNNHIKAMLTEQFCVLLDGPCTYSGRDMASTHATLGLGNAQFNALAEDLQTAMEQMNIPFSAQNKLIAKLAPMQHQIVVR